MENKPINVEAQRIAKIIDETQGKSSHICSCNQTN